MRFSRDIAKDESQLGTLKWVTTTLGHTTFTAAQYQAALSAATRAFLSTLYNHGNN
jgi:hypothetical protein